MTIIPLKAEPETALTIFDTPLTAAQIAAEFKDDAATAAIINIVKLKAAEVPQDMTSDKGRKAIISLSERVRKSRIFLEKNIKEYVDEENKSIKSIKARGEKMTTELNALIQSIREPVDVFNEKEEKRKSALRNAINQIRVIGDIINLDATSAELQVKLNMFAQPDPTDWQEFLDEANMAKANSIGKLNQAILAKKASEEILQKMKDEFEQLRAAQPQPEQVKSPFNETELSGNGLLTTSRTEPLFVDEAHHLKPRGGVTIPPQVSDPSDMSLIELNRKKDMAREKVVEFFMKEMALYEGDSRTIFNWVDLGEIPFFRLDLDAIKKL